MALELQQLLFYVFAFVAVCSAILVVTMNNAVRAVLALVLVFFATSGLWILVQVEFLALILVLVYVGAVMTLFLFMVMMINVDYDTMKKRFLFYFPFAALVLAVIVGLVWMVKPTQFLFMPETKELADTTSAKALGMVVYTDYVYAFEIAAVLLLVAIIAAIALANRGIVRGKKQVILKQLMTRKEDRLRVVKMAVENRERDK